MNLNRKTYLKFFHNFDRLFVRLDEVPEIVFENVRESRKNSLKKSLTPSKSKSPKLTYIITELKKRIRESSGKSSVCVSSGRLKIKGQTDDRVGPGSYSIRTPNKMTGNYKFSTIPRLKTPISHSILNISTLYPVKENNLNDIILKNKLLAATPDVNKSNKESKNFHEKSKEELIKEKKRIIDLENKEIKVNKLKRKIQLYEWRNNRPEIKVVQRTWFAMYTVCGFLSVIKGRGKIKKALKSRWEVFLRHFVVISKIVAKIAIRLKNIRRKILRRNLAGLGLPLADYFSLCISENKRKIQNLLIDYAELPLLSKLMVKVKFSILKLQRGIKNYLTIKKSRIAVIRNLWHRLYLQYIKENPEKSSAIERIGAISKDLIDKYTSRHITKLLRSYNISLESFKASYLENHTTINTQWFHTNKPQLRIYRDHSSLIPLIEKAIKQKDSQQKKQRYRKYSQNK